MHKIQSITTKDNLFIEAVFFDGTIKSYDIKQLFPLYPQLKALENTELFSCVKIDSGGYGISWNDDLDLDAETIWEDGNDIARITVSPIMELAVQLTQARENAGMTQKQLSEKTGIYQADISKIERGIGNPSMLTLQRLAAGLGLRLQIKFM